MIKMLTRLRNSIMRPVDAWCVNNPRLKSWACEMARGIEKSCSSIVEYKGVQLLPQTVPPLDAPNPMSWYQD